jgi:hypothetical protein
MTQVARFSGSGGLDLEVIAGEELVLSHVTKDGIRHTNVRLPAEQVRPLIEALGEARDHIVETRQRPCPLSTPAAERQCRVCGCTDARACWPTCWWVEADLCSMCAQRIRDRDRAGGSK